MRHTQHNTHTHWQAGKHGERAELGQKGLRLTTSGDRAASSAGLVMFSMLETFSFLRIGFEMRKYPIH